MPAADPDQKTLFLPPPYQDSAEAGRLLLKDGTLAMLRPLVPGDQPALAEFFVRMSPESRQHRFFSVSLPGAALLAEMCENRDPSRSLTLGVRRHVDGADRLIAVAGYTANPDAKSAEVAFAVDDRFQGRGLGTALLERLTVLAVRAGFQKLTAVTVANNRAMVEVFRDCGLAVSERADGGYLEIDLVADIGPEMVAKIEHRDRLRTIASLRPFFTPKSVAVVGAGRDPSGIGARVLESLIHARFNGPVYPVNPKAKTVRCIRAYPSVRDLPEPVELAVICVPAAAVLTVIDDCAANGVKGLVVITAGFAEIEGGAELQRTLVERVRGYGMRMVGPNCMGLLNAHPDVRLNASFSPVFPPFGSIAMSSQSGALGLAILAMARNSNLGLSTFVSVGNKADVSGNDLLQYWEDDPDTAVCLLYLESFGNPRRFARIARRVGRRKPIVVVKSGRSEAGRRAASSHTAALASGDAVTAALFAQTGVLRADTLDELFDLAAVLGNQPLPAGRRLAIITNAGGPGILCTDAAEAAGLSVPPFGPALRAELAKFLPTTAGLGNPVDMVASASPDNYAQTLRAVLASEDVDAVVVIYIPVGGAPVREVAEVITRTVMESRQHPLGVNDRSEPGAAGQTATSPSSGACTQAPPATETRDQRPTTGGGPSAHPGLPAKPVLACLMSEQSGRQLLSAGAEKIPVFPYPETPARVLGKVVAYAEWRARPPSPVPDFPDIDWPAARAVCRSAVATRGEGWLSAEETLTLLRAARLPIPGGFARTTEEAATLAERLGFPVAVKLASRTLVHKTEVGGVRLNLPDPSAVRAAFDGIRARLLSIGRADDMEGVLVQPMARGGIELVIGVSEDRSFGPVVMFGLGGIHVEILADVVFRVGPLTDRDADEMLAGIRGAKLLAGYRGHPAADRAAIKDVLLRVGRLAEELPEIAELDLNPLFALPPGQGVILVDARIRVRALGKQV